MTPEANTRLICPQGKFELRRYPARKQESLQAWCSADALLLEAAATSNGKSLVVNDDHGALSLPLAPTTLWTDSALSAEAVRRNAQHNDCQAPEVLWSTQAPPTGVRRVFLRIPKLTPYFEYQLANLARALEPGAQLFCAGMDKHLSPKTANVIERFFSRIERHPGKRKARMFSAIASNSQRPESIPMTRSYQCAPAGGRLEAMPNVFSGEQLDIGSRFLLEHLEAIEPVDSAADLACGNGLLGIIALRQNKAQSLLFADESAMAIASSRINVSRLVDDPARARFHQGDGLLGVEQKFHLILCNPPFHLGHSVDEYAGRRLLRQAADRLQPGGSLLVVANRHLQYGSALKRYVGHCEKLAQNNKFILWCARRS